jgi:hypothetical protein
LRALHGALADAGTCYQCRDSWIAASGIGVAVQGETPQHDFFSRLQVDASRDLFLPREVRTIVGSRCFLAHVSGSSFGANHCWTRMKRFCMVRLLSCTSMTAIWSRATVIGCVLSSRCQPGCEIKSIHFFTGAAFAQRSAGFFFSFSL